MNENLPPHLRSEFSDRGFQRLPAIPSTYGGEVEVYESSAAMGPHIWLIASGPKNLNEPEGEQAVTRVHLTAESARNLADQLNYLVLSHHQIMEEDLDAAARLYMKGFQAGFLEAQTQSQVMDGVKPVCHCCETPVPEEENQKSEIHYFNHQFGGIAEITMTLCPACTLIIALRVGELQKSWTKLEKNLREDPA